MKKLWRKHKLLVLGVPCAVAVVVAAFIGYLQYQKSVEVKACIAAGNRYLSELDYEQAIASYRQALDVDEKNKEANLGLAEAYDSNNMFTYAEAVYRNMLEIDDLQADVYEKLADIYMRQQKLDEAKDLLEEAVEKVDDEVIEQLYYVTRPEPPSVNHTSGEYKERIRVELIPSEDKQTIYYTIDGTEPTSESAVYETPLILRNGETTIKAMVINATGYQSDIAVYEYDIDIQDILVELEEPLIEQIIRNKLQIPYGEPIYNDDIEQITEIYIVGTSVGDSADTHNVFLEENAYSVDGYGYSLYAEGQISTLNDLRYMPFLDRVVAVYQPGLDIGALAECSSVTELSLVGDNLTAQDLEALKDLTGLVKLNLGWNNIREISSLSGLLNLTSLGIWGNQISDISAVSGLVNLEYLDFSDNRVSDMTPVAGLTTLKQLWMYNNNIKDISSLAGLENLQVLMLRDNPIENPEAVRSVYPHLTRIDVDLLNLGGDTE